MRTLVDGLGDLKQKPPPWSGFWIGVRIAIFEISETTACHPAYAFTTSAGFSIPQNGTAPINNANPGPNTQSIAVTINARG